MAANATVSLTIKLKDLVSGPARGMKRELGGIRKSFSGLGKTFDMAGKVGFAASAVNQLGTQARGLLTSILAPALKFEDTMARVGALTTGITKKGMAELTDTAREMGRTTRFTAQEAADGLGQLAIAGFDAAEQMAALPAVLDLTQASGTEMGRVADIASDLMGAFGKEAEDVGEISGVLAATFSNSTTTLETLFETMKLVAPIATAAKISMQDLAVMTGLLGNAGIKGSQAGTALTNGITRLAAAGGKGAKTLNKYGVSAKDIEKNLKTPLVILSKLNDEFDKQNLSEPARLKELSKIFGKRGSGLSSIITLMNEMSKEVEGGGTAYDKLAASVANGESELARIAETMSGTRLAKVQKFQSAMESLKLDLAAELAPVFSDLVADLTELAGGFASWAKENPGLVRGLGKLLIGTVAFSAVLGPLLLATSSLISAFGVLKGLSLVMVAPLRLLGGAYMGLTDSMIRATGASGKMKKGLMGVQGAVGIVAAGFAGWQVGKWLDEAIGKTLKLRGELLSTELALTGAESEGFNVAVSTGAERLGLTSLKEAADTNIEENVRRKVAADRARGRVDESWLQESVSGKIEIEVTDERVKIKKVESKAGPDLVVGVNARTP